MGDDIGFLAVLCVLGLVIGRALRWVSARLLRKSLTTAYSRLGLPLWECATSAAFLWIGFRQTALSPYEWIAGLLLASVLIVITYTDWKEMIIPNRIVFPGIAAAVLLRIFIHPLPLWDYFAGAAAAFAILYLLAVASRGGMGGGDIKLYVFIGLLLGFKLTLISLFAASLFGAFYGGAKLFIKKQKLPIPFGPFIAAGAFLAFLYGEEWIDSYISFLTM